MTDELPKVRVRQRVRPAPEATPEPQEPRARVRVRPGPQIASAAPAEAPSAFRKRHYTADEARELAGKPEDPVARGAYSNQNIITCSVHAGGRGDNTAGKIWRIGDNAFMVWAITMDGRMTYIGKQTGSFQQVFDRLLARTRATALARARMSKAPNLYEEWRGSCKPRKAAA